MYKSVAFARFTMFCNHYLSLEKEAFYHLQRKLCTHYAATPNFLLSPAPGNLNLLYAYGFTYSIYSHKWNHTVGDLQCPASFT